jgi:Protein of unknown function (DUF2757)
MAIQYHCRHCGVQMGKLDNMSLHSEKLGLHKLTDQERLDMVSYDNAGDIHTKAICEDCHESLERNPDYYQNDYLIH